MDGDRFLVTGGTGCIGSWVVRQLVREGAPVTVLTSSGRLDRLALVLSPSELAAQDVVEGDLLDVTSLEAVARDRGITRIVHLAALQFPFCAADPIKGARVNVEGTVAMFQLAKRLGIGRLVYASSAAVYGPAARYGVDVLPADAELYPTSWYGVYKVANEQGARVAWETEGVASIGLRPHSVYGPGRDQGVTSKPTVAMIAAAAGRPYHVNFGGRYQFQFAEDAARAFVAAARADLDGAQVFSLPGPAFGVDEIVAAIEMAVPAAAGSITFEDRILPFPGAFDGAPLEAALGPLPQTPLADGVAATIAVYRSAIADGRLDGAWLDRVLSA
jgi:nucleoside-diphosphate-sugar epimerase